MSGNPRDVFSNDPAKAFRKPSVVPAGHLVQDFPHTSKSVGQSSRSRPTGSSPSRPTRKRAASVDTEIANHPQIKDLAINSDNSTTPENGIVRERVCLCQPDPKIPRPRNAFILYRQHYQAQIVAQHPGLANPEISKIIGEQWRDQPPEVKEEWKRLAEEEKERHHRQYPDYRYQPRRLTKPNGARPVTSSSPDSPARCPKCNGRYISAPSTPITPLPLESLAYRQGPVCAQPSAQLSYNKSYLSSLANMPRAVPTDQPMHRRPAVLQNRPMMQAGALRDRDDEMETMISPSPEQKRRRFVEGPGGYSIPSPYGPTQRIARPPMSAVGYDERRGMPSSFGTPKYHVAGSMMEPPPRPIPAVHQYSPLTSTFDESLRLPPLQTQAPVTGSSPRRPETQRMDSQARSIEAMVMTIPHIHKIKVLAKVAPPLAPAGPLNPAQDIRGAVVAIEGSDAQLLVEVGKYIEDYLGREPECLVRTWRGPSEIPDGDKRKEGVPADVEMNGIGFTQSPSSPASSDPFVTYLETIHFWHERSREIKQFATTDPSPGPSPSPPPSLPNPSTIQFPPEPAANFTSPIVLPSKPPKPRIPVALLPSGFSLTISDAFGSSIPIHDAYAPLDHWQWMATLWRGIVGPDLTIYVKAIPNDRESIEETNRHGNVEIRNDCAAIIVRAEVKAGEAREREGKIEEKILRRLGFEVLEFVRGGFGAVPRGFRGP